MPTPRQLMEDALKVTVVRALRARGFKGSLPHFRRQREDGIDLVTFQFDKHGGGFVVETGRCSGVGVTLHWGERVAPTKVTVSALHPNQRRRIKPMEGPGTDSWFRYERGDYASVARQALSLLDAAPETAVAGA